ncbi:hypothetical protein CMUST_10555 [Corynebacterium mustelae]|uniref:Uncharacterized protein n=1 Tax=Corynebacterium mustelae TaxID=571915 RepID=A0A0G3H5J3_9CORY|nr:hypothetical protein [Corynebacterium mustelae]AKK06427.1 hypothetical protein CMUST_10555 [Corynebacterium mustelae]
MAVGFIRPHAELNDVPLVAARYETGLDDGYLVVRLVAKPLVEAETLALNALGLSKTGQNPVGFTTRRAVGFPAWPIFTDPANAQHALNVVADVEWARRKAKNHPVQVKERIDALVGTLQASAPQFLPTFLEEIARIFAVSDNTSYAKQYFGKAREMERVHALAIDPIRHAQAFKEFASYGVVSAKTLSEESRDVANRTTPEEAYDYFLSLITDQARAGSGVYTHVFKDLQALGRQVGLSPREVNLEFAAAYLPTRSFPHSPETLMNKILSLVPELKKTKPELVDILLTTIPVNWDFDTYLQQLQKLGLWEQLQDDPNRFAKWLESLIEHGNSHSNFLDRSNPEFLLALDDNSDALAGMTLRTVSSHYHLDYLDAFLAAGINWSALPPKNSWQPMFSFKGWLQERYRNLAHIVSHVAIQTDLIDALSFSLIASHTDEILSGEPTRALVSWKLETLRKPREAATGSKALWDEINNHIECVSNPRLRELNPEAVDEILKFSPAAELAERLRRGTAVEYTWPALEELAPLLADEQFTIHANFPQVAITHDQKAYVLDGADVTEYQLPAGDYALVVPTTNDVFVIYFDHSLKEKKWMWLSDRVAHTMADDSIDAYTGSYSQVIDDTLYIGPTAITTKLKCAPTGMQLGFGPVYAVATKQDAALTVLPVGGRISHEDFKAQFKAGTLAGLDIPQAIAVAATHDAVIDLTLSFTVDATVSTFESPFGVDDAQHFGFSLETKSLGRYWVSPLGTFHSTGAPFLAVKKPQGDVWYMRSPRHFGGHGHLLYDAATDAPIAPSLAPDGMPHIINHLPFAAFHQLRPRNEEVSAKLRACTVEQAAEMIANPVGILDFALGDETLAAAIAGIIADISEIFGANIKLPALDSIPQFLAHLYQTVTPVEESNNEIPKPPSIDINGRDSYEIEHVQQLAQILAAPQLQGEVTFHRFNNFMLATVAKEKRWLSWLASPGLPLDTVRIYHAFLTWCATYGVLGTWRKISLPKPATQNSPECYWDNNVLVINHYNFHAKLWNPTYSIKPEQAFTAHGLDDELFMPKDEFTKALDDILSWHERRHESKTALTPGWDYATIAEKAAEAAAISTLPPRFWSYFFAGIRHRYRMPFARESENIVSDMLGLSKRHITALEKSLPSNLGYLDDDFLGIGWHEHFLTDGPDINRIQAMWEQLWGAPWIHLNDDMLERIPHQLYKYIGASFHGQPESEVTADNSASPELLPVYVTLAHEVQPGSEQAHALAHRIRVLAEGDITHADEPLGADYDSVKNQPELLPRYGLKLVREGYLDVLLKHLQAGIPCSGTAQDPCVAAPETVADAAETLNISNDAARYFLQLLALTKPTDKDVKAWNNWSKHQLEQASEELLGKNLVISAKRAGAGRTIFLPGGWLTKSDDGPALEMWKAPHYLLWKDTKTRPVLSTCPPLVPYPELFAEVWARYTSGDTPGYEELKTTRYRSKR